MGTLLGWRIELAHELAARAIALCDRHGFPYFGGLSRFALGFATAHLGRTGEGIKLIRDGVERFAAMDAHLGLTQYITWLAEALRLHGTEADALATIGGAFQANPEELIFIPQALRATMWGTTACPAVKLPNGLKVPMTIRP